MKKFILTFSVIALFSVAAKAQDKTTTTKKDNNTTTTTTKQSETAPSSTGVNSATGVNPDGTAATPAPVTPTEKKETSTAPKKSGTRMAINEKGVPGGSSSKKDAPKEEKSNTPK